jgi:transposase
MNVTRIGLDLAKDVFQVHGVDRQEHTVIWRRLKRGQVKAFFAALPPCVIAMEACASAHFWGREFARMGHEIRLMAPHLVKPYINKQKNDANDAEGICEAASRSGMRFVAVKSVEQQDMQAVHRVRGELVRQRTAKANQIRGLLAEHGITLPIRIESLRRALPAIQEDSDNGLTALFRHLLGGLRDDLKTLDERVAALDREIETAARADPVACRLQSVPGIGPITATALAAAFGDARQFKHGRDLAACLGLTPGQHSSGGKAHLLGISKHGDGYLRTLLIHGARAVLKTAARKTDPRSRWLVALSARRHKNTAAVALANNNACIVWALLTRGGGYDSRHGMSNAA